MQEITRETFPSEVLASKRPVLIDFWGPQCVPCLQLMPAIEDLEAEHEGRLKVVKVEAPKNRRLCLNLKVMSLPTFLLFNNGVEVKRITGDVTQQQLRDATCELVVGLPKT